MIIELPEEILEKIAEARFHFNNKMEEIISSLDVNTLQSLKKEVTEEDIKIVYNSNFYDRYIRLTALFILAIKYQLSRIKELEATGKFSGVYCVDHDDDASICQLKHDKEIE